LPRRERSLQRWPYWDGRVLPGWKLYRRGGSSLLAVEQFRCLAERLFRSYPFFNDSPEDVRRRVTLRGVAIKRSKAAFVEPMLLLKSSSLPDDDGWIREIKLDGYRAIAFKSAGKLELRSRNDNDMAVRYPVIARALAKLPDETVVDGELAALDADGRPSFNLLQNYRNSTGPLVYFMFDLLVLSGRDLKMEPLERRRGLLETRVMPKLAEPIRLSPALEGSMQELVQSVKENRLEGLVAKRKDSAYEPGMRTGAWRKMRVNLGQEFVIGGYTPSAKNFDAMVIGYYEAGKLIYSARVRNGFTPASRVKLFEKIKPLETDTCPICQSS
jgi:ATP-dependent DNA ligase